MEIQRFKKDRVFAILEWYKLGLRHEFSMHRRKTVESFSLVRGDISAVYNIINTIKNSLSSLEFKLSAIETEGSSLRSAIEKCNSDINLQQNSNLNIQSRIENVNQSMGVIAETIDLIKKKTSISSTQNRSLSKKITAQNRLMKKLVPRSKKQALQISKLSSSLRKSQDDVKKLRNLLIRKLRTSNKRDLELEIRLKRQRRAMISLNRKIEIRKMRSKTSGRRPRKVITKIITPKKTITTIKTPRRTITKKVTPRKTVVKEVTANKEKVYEVIKEKNSLI